MKGKHILFLAVPALLLASCNSLGSEITDSSAIADKVSAIAEKTKDIKNFKFVIDMEGSNYDEETKKNVSSKSHIALECNEDGEIHCKSESTQGGEKAGEEFYIVNNATYQKVMYLDNLEGGKHDITVYGYEGNATAFAEAQMSILAPAMYMAMFADPTNIAEASALTGEDSDDVVRTFKYYSAGEGDLTISVKVAPKDVESVKKAEQEETISASVDVHYVNNVLKDAKIEGASNKGNKNTMKMTLEVKNKFAINLPSGWETKINQKAAA
ncbi:MAG: hypothetical protein K6B51_01205 [Bacilli bacterium]|nr:hypothetical protein [Bacilli bacterium]